MPNTIKAKKDGNNAQVVSSQDIGRYLRLRDKGYEAVWVGENKIQMVKKVEK